MTKEERAEYNKRYYEAHRDQLRERYNNWAKNNREKRREASKRWRKNHPEYYQTRIKTDPEKMAKRAEYRKEYYQNREKTDPEKVAKRAESRAKWRRDNKEKSNAYKREWRRKKRMQNEHTCRDLKNELESRPPKLIITKVEKEMCND